MRRVPLAHVERQILEQHEEIRARLRALTRGAERADLPWAQRVLRILLLRFAADFEAHLAFEERELAPRMGSLGDDAREREAALHAEHREQRRRLEEVCALAEDPASADTIDLLVAVTELADSLYEDLLEEERAIAELVRTEARTIEQMAG